MTIALFWLYHNVHVVVGYVIRTREALSGRPLNRATAIGVAFVLCGLSSLAEAARKPSVSSPHESPCISTEALLASPFARYYHAKDYPKALKALDALLQTYPDDPLILRYRAKG